MSITVDETVTGYESGTTASVTFAAIPDDGQMIILILYDRGGTEGTPPTGFTAGPSIGTGDWTSMWYREASSEASATYTITAIDGDQHGQRGIILDATNGWDATTPVSGSATGYDAGFVATLDIAMAAVAAGFGDSIGVALLSLRDDYSAETISWDESFTELGKHLGGANPYITGACATRIITATVAAATLTATWTTAIADVRGLFLWLHEASGSVVETVIRPIWDTAGTGWDSAPTGSQDLYLQVDEVVASDTDYIYAMDPNP